MSAAPEWQRDSLLDGYEAVRLPLDAEPLPGEPLDTPLTGTLLRRNPSGSRRAVLYLHGWNDYFFQTHLADFWAGLGYDFHALELRRYGRNLVEGQFKGFVADLDDYAEELDAACRLIVADHDELVLMGHSTGGLVACLWADRRPGLVTGLVLNSPWLDLHGSPWIRAASGPVLSRLGAARPSTPLRLPNNGFYLRTITDQGQWQLQPEWKNAVDFVPRLGWMAAIVEGHKRVSAGLDIEVPVLVATSARSDFSRSWSDELGSVDMVLDVTRIRAAAVNLGPHVTLVRIEGGMHDLALSSEPARGHYLDEVSRWVGAYL